MSQNREGAAGMAGAATRPMGPEELWRTAQGQEPTRMFPEVAAQLETGP